MDTNLLDALKAYSDSQEQKIAQLEQTRKNLESFMTANADKNDNIVEMVGKLQSQIDVIQKNTDYILRHISYMQEEILTLTKKIFAQPQQEKMAETQHNHEEIEIVPLDIVHEPTHISKEEVAPQPIYEPKIEPQVESIMPEVKVEPAVTQTPIVEETITTPKPTAPTPEPQATQKEFSTANTTYENGFSQSAPYIDDIRKAISLGDRFLFQRELFKGNPELFQKTLENINEMHSCDEALRYINSQFAWDKESIAYQTFVNAIKRRFQEH